MRSDGQVMPAMPIIRQCVGGAIVVLPFYFGDQSYWLRVKVSMRGTKAHPLQNRACSDVGSTLGPPSGYGVACEVLAFGARCFSSSEQLVDGHRGSVLRPRSKSIATRTSFVFHPMGGRGMRAAAPVSGRPEKAPYLLTVRRTSTVQVEPCCRSAHQLGMCRGPTACAAHLLNELF